MADFHFFDVAAARKLADERRSTLSARRELAQLISEPDKLEPGAPGGLALCDFDLSLELQERFGRGARDQRIDGRDVAHQERACRAGKFSRLIALTHRILHSVVGTTDGRGDPARGKAPSRRRSPKGGA